MSAHGSLTITAAVVVALCAPAAAQPQDTSGSDARAGVPTSTPAIPRIRIVQAPSTGFEWGDAAIGSAATLALILLAAGGAMTVRPGGRASPRDRPHRPGPPS
jgi:hypothetical protein